MFYVVEMWLMFHSAVKFRQNTHICHKCICKANFHITTIKISTIYTTLSWEFRYVSGIELFMKNFGTPTRGSSFKKFQTKVRNDRTSTLCLRARCSFFIGTHFWMVESYHWSHRAKCNSLSSSVKCEVGLKPKVRKYDIYPWLYRIYGHYALTRAYQAMNHSVHWHKFAELSLIWVNGCKFSRIVLKTGQRAFSIKTCPSCNHGKQVINGAIHTQCCGVNDSWKCERPTVDIMLPIVFALWVIFVLLRKLMSYYYPEKYAAFSILRIKRSLVRKLLHCFIFSR